MGSNENRWLRGPNFEKNVGGAERALRLGIGSVLLLTGTVLLLGLLPVELDPFPRAGASVLAVLAGSRLLWTGYTQKCYLNRRLGRNSYGR